MPRQGTLHLWSVLRVTPTVPAMTRSIDLPGSDRSGWVRRADEETAPNGRSVALGWVVVKPYPPKVFG